MLALRDFQDITDDREVDWLSRGGLAETVTPDLKRLKLARVVSRGEIQEAALARTRFTKSSRSLHARKTDGVYGQESAVGFLFSRFAPARKSPQIISESVASRLVRTQHQSRCLACLLDNRELTGRESEPWEIIYFCTRP